MRFHLERLAVAKPIDFTGQRFSRLVAVLRVAPVNGQTFWLFRCDCGTEKPIDLANVRRGATTSCGCFAAETAHLKGREPRHGMVRTSEYAAWRSMKARCLNSTHKAFPSYGGRGIKVCERWLHGDGAMPGFDCFIADMGRKPEINLTLDRIDNSGDYEPANCRWSSMTTQCRNRRSSRFIEIHGESMTVSAAAERYAVPPQRIISRLKRGWSDEDAVFRQPVLNIKRQSLDA